MYLVKEVFFFGASGKSIRKRLQAVKGSLCHLPSHHPPRAAAGAAGPMAAGLGAQTGSSRPAP